MSNQTNSQKRYAQAKSIRDHNRTNVDPRYSKMTFGKYKGYYLKDVPYEYLTWCIVELEDNLLNEFLAHEITKRPEWRAQEREYNKLRRQLPKKIDI